MVNCEAVETLISFSDVARSTELQLPDLINVPRQLSTWINLGTHVQSTLFIPLIRQNGRGSADGVYRIQQYLCGLPSSDFSHTNHLNQ